MRFILGLLLLGGAVGACAAEAAPKEEGVVWASEPAGKAQWHVDVTQLRQARSGVILPGYLHTEEVSWGRYHDPGVYALKDGREMNVSLNGWKWEQVNAWPKGKKLFLCYDEARGATLLDPETKRWLIVRHIWDPNGKFVHPIADYVESLHPGSTYDIMSAHQEAERLWKLEIDRSVREVLALKHLPKDVRAGFIALTKTRLEYCRAQLAFGGAAIHADITGTAAGPMTCDYAASLYRDAFEHLSKVSEAYLAFDRPPEK